jgi:diguanylate cyclase (GGDEF)-like protein
MIGQLEYQAFHDRLTGLPNRALFHDRVEQALARRLRQPTPMVLLFIDLDDFKDVNDGLGHAAGDELLIAVAQRVAMYTAKAHGNGRFELAASDTPIGTERRQAIIRVLRCRW